MIETDFDSIIVCVNLRSPDKKSCAGSGSEALVKEVRDVIAENNIDIEVKTFKCLGFCQQGPVLRVTPGGRFFENFSSADITELVEYITQDKDK